jgi:hypothetical protein
MDFRTLGVNRVYSSWFVKANVTAGLASMPSMIVYLVMYGDRLASATNPPPSDAAMPGALGTLVAFAWLSFAAYRKQKQP